MIKILTFNKPLSWYSVILTLVFIEPGKDRLFKRNDFGILGQISLTSLVYSAYRYRRLLLLIRAARVELSSQGGLNESEAKNQLAMRLVVTGGLCKRCCDSFLT